MMLDVLPLSHHDRGGLAAKHLTHDAPWINVWILNTGPILGGLQIFILYSWITHQVQSGTSLERRHN